MWLKCCDKQRQRGQRHGRQGSRFRVSGSVSETSASAIGSFLQHPVPTLSSANTSFLEGSRESSRRQQLPKFLVAKPWTTPWNTRTRILELQELWNAAVEAGAPNVRCPVPTVCNLFSCYAVRNISQQIPGYGSSSGSMERHVLLVRLAVILTRSVHTGNSVDPETALSICPSKVVSMIKWLMGFLDGVNFP